MNYSVSDIASIVESIEIVGHPKNRVQSIYIDSRQISIPQNALFIAIETTKNDGHKYISDAYKKGIRTFLVRYIPSSAYFEDACYIRVHNTLKALHKWAAAHRQKFQIPVIAITGSNGKTIVKEWLYFLLKDDYSICRSPRSFNSQIGVPISVLNLQDTHTLAIFEAGISQTNEMPHLERIIQPTIAILTHLGNAHSEGFAHEDEKLQEKLKLLKHAPIALIQRTHHPFLQQKKHLKTFTCISELPDDTVRVLSIQKHLQTSVIHIQIDHSIYPFQIPFIDDASVKNAITCLATIYYLDQTKIHSVLPKFKELPSISLRLEIKKGKFQSTLISDYYNCDIDSFEIALSYFHQYPTAPSILILSDFENIKNPDEIYSRAIQMIHQYPLKKLILIGTEWKKYLSILQIPHEYYFTTADFVEKIPSQTDYWLHATILIKGARRYEFEKIAQHLELKTHDTILEINIPALWHNLHYYKNKVDKNVKLMCMLKAEGYGSGSIEMAYALQKFGVDYLAVAYTDEAIELRQANIQLPIMIMLPEKQSFNDIIQYQLEPEIYSLDILKDFLKALQSQGIQHYPVHIKLDTGMHRLGFLPDEVPALIHILQSTTHLQVKSIFSHLAASESDTHKNYTLQQIHLFETLAHQIEKHLPYPVLKHLCNSAAINRYPQAHYDMVRLGIGMYGLSEDPDEQKYLQNVWTLKTKIAQIKHLKKGDSIGYNRQAILDKDSTIAVIPIGYADGFFRKLGNGNFQLKINQQQVNTIGNVCMDMTMINISNVLVHTGDEVIIFDTAEDIKRLAKQCQTIPYEILTSISQRIKRVYLYE